MCRQTGCRPEPNGILSLRRAAIRSSGTHDQFRWFGGGWDVSSDLSNLRAFAAATTFVRPEDVAASIRVVQVGDELQDRLLDEATEPLLAKFRAASSAANDSA